MIARPKMAKSNFNMDFNAKSAHEPLISRS